jgi:hypothetical protein
MNSLNILTIYCLRSCSILSSHVTFSLPSLKFCTEYSYAILIPSISRLYYLCRLGSCNRIWRRVITNSAFPHCAVFPIVISFYLFQFQINSSALYSCAVNYPPSCSPKGLHCKTELIFINRPRANLVNGKALQTVQWHRRLFAGLLPRSSAFKPKQTHVWFMALEQAFLRVFWFSPATIMLPMFHTH